MWPPTPPGLCIAGMELSATFRESQSLLVASRGDDRSVNPVTQHGWPALVTHPRQPRTGPTGFLPRVKNARAPLYRSLLPSVAPLDKGLVKEG